jgi:hypothetical protein
MRTLAKFHLQLKSREQLDDPQAVVTAAAHVLRSFPDNFHKLLLTIGEQSVSKQCSRSVRSQFSNIYFAIFHRFRAGDPPETRDFLGCAFLDFAINHWRRGVIHPNLQHRLQKNIPKRFITPTEFGERYGLDRRTVARVLAMKSIRTIKIPMGKTNRLLIDLQHLHEPPTVRGKVFSRKTAAAAIGVTAEALSSLRASGDFEVKYLIRRTGYHERDIKQFMERLLALNPSTTNKTLPRDCITLNRAVRRYHPGGGENIIRALLSGRLRVSGNVDGSVRGLFVSRAEFQQFGKNERARPNGNARTALEAAKEIRCAPPVSLS